MNNLLSEILKIDVALEPEEIAAAPIDTDWFDMSGYRSALFVVEMGRHDDGDDIDLLAREATDADGSDAQSFAAGDYGAAVGDTMESLVHVAEAEVTIRDTATDTITINGITYTGDDTPDRDDREYDTSGTAQDAAESLVDLINDDDLGVPGIEADNTAAVLELSVEEPGERYMTITYTGITAAETVKSVAYIEVSAEYISNGFTHVGLRLTPDAATDGGVILLRGKPRYKAPAQYVAASDTMGV